MNPTTPANEPAQTENTTVEVAASRAIIASTVVSGILACVTTGVVVWTWIHRAPLVAVVVTLAYTAASIMALFVSLHAKHQDRRDRQAEEREAQRLADAEQRIITHLDQRLDQVGQRLDQVEQRQHRITKRIEKMEDEVTSAVRVLRFPHLRTAE